jgi:hypothetical protein
MNLPHFFVKHVRKVLIKVKKNFTSLNAMEFKGLRFFDIIGPLMQFGIFDEGSGNDLR